MGSPHQKTVLFVFGTRPEAIKLAPLIRAFQNDAHFKTEVCVTAQHRELLDQILDFFGVQPTVDLDLMLPSQSLAELASRVICSCAAVYARLKPDFVFVQGDTTSAFAAAFAASLQKFPVAHVEAGLRSHRKDAPFPEEINRVLIGQLAELHFAHSQGACENLQRGGISRGIHHVGNTGIDALKLTLKLMEEARGYEKSVPALDATRKMVLITMHRRENFGRRLTDICHAFREVAAENPVDLIFPVHPNPQVRAVVYEVLSGVANIHLIAPLTYGEFIWLLTRADLVVSDSGGVLEEAETLGVPGLVTRDVTERGEAFTTGEAVLVGTNPLRIVAEARARLTGTKQTHVNRPLRTTFGDGLASERIVGITKEHLGVARDEMPPS